MVRVPNFGVWSLVAKLPLGISTKQNLKLRGKFWGVGALRIGRCGRRLGMMIWD